MNCNLFYNLETNESVVVPKTYDKEEIIKKIGEDFKQLSVIEVPCFDEKENAYYLYEFTNFLNKTKILLHLKNRKFYQAILFKIGYHDVYHSIYYINKVDEFQKDFEKACEDNEKYNASKEFEFDKITEEEASKWIHVAKTIWGAFNWIKQ